MLADRLRAAGYADSRVVHDPGLDKILVTDPDGCELEIHAASAG